MINFTEAINNISKTAGLFSQKGWAESNAGNISVRLQNSTAICPELDKISEGMLPRAYPALGGEQFILTASGRRMRDLKDNPLSNIVWLKFTGDDGRSYELYGLSGKKGLRPTSELPTHLLIHEKLKLSGSNDIAVLHTHATELIAITHHPEYKDSVSLSRLIWSMHPESMLFLKKGAGVIPYCLTGSDLLASETIKQLDNYDIFVWEKHGALAIGTTPEEAFDKLDIAAKSIEIWFKCKSAGFEPEGLTDGQLEELKLLCFNK